MGTFRLGGSYPATAGMQAGIISTFNSNDPKLFKQYANILGINSIVLKKGELYHPALFSLFPSNLSFDDARSLLNRDFKVVNETDNYILYKNADALPPVYSPESVTVISSTSSDDIVRESMLQNAAILSSMPIAGKVPIANMKVVDFREINPTLYQISTNGKQGLLVFNQSYHTGWHAYYIDEGVSIHWYDILFGLSRVHAKLIPPEDHVLTNGFANGWITGNYTSKNIVIVFAPQRGFDIGLFITFTTLLTCLVYLGYSRYKNEGSLK